MGSVPNQAEAPAARPQRDHEANSHLPITPPDCSQRSMRFHATYGECLVADRQREFGRKLDDPRHCGAAKRTFASSSMVTRIDDLTHELADGRGCVLCAAARSLARGAGSKRL